MVVSKSGPYISVPISEHECKFPTKPYEKVRSMIVRAEIVDHTFTQGNLTVLAYKKWKNLMIRGRIYRKEDGGWKIIKIMNSDGCRGIIVSSFMKFIGAPLDKKYCGLALGIYKFNKIDLNRLEHIWWPTQREYGHFRWMFEVMTPSVTITCFEYESSVRPLSTNGRGTANRTRTAAKN